MARQNGKAKPNLDCLEGAELHAPMVKAEPAPRDGDEIDRLTHRQRLFVHYYLSDQKGNAKRAARMAGYAQPQVAGPRLARDPAVRAALKSGVKDAGLSIPEIAARLAEQATVSMDDFITISDSGEIALDLQKARQRGKLHLVHSLVPTKHGFGIKLHDAQAALVHLGRASGMFVDRLSLSAEFDPSKLSTEQLKAIADGKG